MSPAALGPRITQNKWFYHIAAKYNISGRYRSILIKLIRPANLLSRDLPLILQRAVAPPPRTQPQYCFLTLSKPLIKEGPRIKEAASLGAPYLTSSPIAALYPQIVA